MIGFTKVPLQKLINNVGEDKAKNILSDFCCPLNKDIETFLRQKAIEFEKQSISATHLVYTSYKDSPVLVGYYTFSIKSFTVPKSAISRSLSKRINKFSAYDNDLKSYILPAPLLAQLGKNYANNYNNLITGDELLDIAIEDIRIMQQVVGGKVLYLECENKQKLLDFYQSNGFVKFSERKLDKDETDITGSYLVQMLRYL